MWRGEALAWATLRRGGSPFHRGEEGCRGLRWSLPPLPHRSASTPTRAAPRPRRGVDQLPSLPPPALPAPGAPRRATLRGREGAGGAGRAGTPGLPEVAGPPRRHRPRSPLTPAAAAVGDVARRGAAGV